MGTRHRFEIPELFPQPKQLELGEGISELAVDVRLATSNVWPIQRKALRSILTMGGVRVVANKKKYVVDARVIEDDPEAFNLSDVPEECRRDYYELRVQGSEVFVRSPYQEGMVWAAQTMTCLFRLMINGIAVPNLFLRDWPTLPQRGIVMDCDWWTVHMNNTDWYTLLDSMSQFKLNLLGISVYGCNPPNPCRGNDAPEEYLLLSCAGQNDLNEPKTPVNSRYYNAKFDRWYLHDAPPPVYENDAFADVIGYGRERGVVVYPCFDFSAAAKALPKAMPELSARNAKGRPANEGFCIGSPSARAAIAGMLTGIVARYYPDGLEFFQLDVSGLFSGDAAGRCQCAKCKGADPHKAAVDFLGFIIGELLDNGVGKVVLASACLGNNGRQVKDSVNALLKNTAFKNRLVVKWQGSADGNGRKVQLPGACRIAGAEAWLSMPGCVWPQGSDGCELADVVACAALKGKAAGALLKLQFDPAYQAMFAMLGVRCWESPGEEDTAAGLLERWAQIYWENASADLLDVRRELLDLVSDPLYRKCLFGSGLTLREPEPCGKNYPECALQLLEKEGPEAVSQLDKLSKRAENAIALVNQHIGNRHWNDLQRMSLQSLIATAAMAKVTVQLMGVLLVLRKGPIKPECARTLEAARQQLMADLLVIEGNLPDWLVPAAMQRMGCNKLFLEQLIGEVKAASKSGTIHWSLPEDWQPPEEK